jgi:histidinol-phosphatase (PHP family)
LRKYYEPSIAAAAEKNVAIEINTAGLRKPVGELYPSQEFLEMAHAAGIPLLINSDAHSPLEVGANFPEAVALAKEAGYKQTLRFEKRKRTFAPLQP